MAITIYKIMIATLMVVAFMLLLSPAFFSYDSPSVANSLNVTAFNSSNSLHSFVFTQVNSTAYGGSNHTSGFFAQVTVFSGLAFVFSGIGYIMQALSNMPYIILYLISTPLSILGFPLSSISIIVGMFIELILFIITIVGVSAWMKYDLRNG